MLLCLSVTAGTNDKCTDLGYNLGFKLNAGEGGCKEASYVLGDQIDIFLSAAQESDQCYVDAAAVTVRVTCFEKASNGGAAGCTADCGKALVEVTDGDASGLAIKVKGGTANGDGNVGIVWDPSGTGYDGAAGFVATCTASGGNCQGISHMSMCFACK